MAIVYPFTSALRPKVEDTRPVLVTCMKDEGIFLLEWVAYHRVIGFEKIVVNTNNCSDGTDTMCDRLAELGYLEHVDNVVEPGGNPQVTALTRLLDRDDIRGRDWLLHIDADEFLVISFGNGRLQDYLSIVDPRASVVALRWRNFGAGHDREWEPSLVTERYVRTTPKPVQKNINHKSMFRPWQFASANDHQPKHPIQVPFLTVNATNRQMSGRTIYNPERSAYRNGPQFCTFENACIHHYALKSQDVFRLKGQRGHGTGVDNPKYQIRSKFWRRNRGRGKTDMSATRHIEEVRALLGEMRADPEIARLESAAQDWFIACREAMYERDRAATAEPDNG